MTFRDYTGTHKSNFKNYDYGIRQMRGGKRDNGYSV